MESLNIINEEKIRQFKIFDAQLTEDGVQQAQSIRRSEYLNRAATVSKVGLDQALWVVSPLTRALQTFLHCGYQTANKVRLSALMSEQCKTSADVGRPLSEIQLQFPDLFLFCKCDGVEERWWYAPDKNCAVKKMWGKEERLDEFKARVDRFSSWLNKQPEKLVILVGHGLFFKQFARMDSVMQNCEVVSMWW
eukprot:TRINITY_DN59_c2_g1_i3.p4 TRINITY_DN59_c2_g1~~TRINITY_DN59_c2_g1_i3.p4  ORF type:complete len:193 (-),score=30.32 TRINITY_DN59_c2_g1_i3:87-665(-)